MLQQILERLPTANEYEPEPVAIGEDLWRLRHQPSGRWHRFKTGVSEKQRYFLANEAYWLRRLTSLSSACCHGIYDMDPHRVLITEYLDGLTVAALIREQGAGFAGHEKVILQLYEALKACHQLGVVHGDIKPNNLIFNGQSLFLIDFANADRERNQISERPFRGYSPSYSLPCLQRGVGEVSPLMDWFAYLIVVRLILGGSMPKFDWQASDTASSMLVTWLAGSGLPANDRLFLESVAYQLDAYC
ncbi:MAG: phosphotransferase [Amphritea sp.]